MDNLIALFNAGKFAAALAGADQIESSQGASATLHNFKGVCWQRLGKVQRSLAEFEAALDMDPDFAPALNNLGSLLSTCGRSSEAITPLEKAIAITPDYADAYCNLANCLRQLGRREEAESNYQNAIECQPEHFEAILSLSQIRRWSSGDPLLSHIKSLLQLNKQNISAAARLHLALSNASFGLGDNDTGCQHLHAGNRLRKQELRYDIKQDIQLFSQIKKRFADNGEKTALSAKECKDELPIPVFIVGLPRSGTSLIEQILSSHPEVYGAGELAFMTRSIQQAEKLSKSNSPEYFRLIHDSYFEQLADRGAVSKPFFTDKMPLNFRWLGHIAQCFPVARIIHIRRDAMDTCWSLYRNYFAGSGNGFAYDQKDIVAYYRLYEDLMNFWQTRQDVELIELDYNELVADSDTVIADLLDRIGLEFSDRCLQYHRNERAVNTASALQVRQENFTRSRPDWRDVHTHIEDLIEGLDQQV